MEGVFKLPVEIQEKILGLLDPGSLMAAVKASPDVWSLITEQRLFRIFCLRYISKDVLTDLSGGRYSEEADIQVNNNLNWKAMLSTWTRTIGVGDDVLSPEYQVVRVVTYKCSSFAVSGDSIIVGDFENNVIWYNALGVRKYSKSNGDVERPVTALSPLNIALNEPLQNADGTILEHDACVVITDDFLTVYAMRCTWQCQQLLRSAYKRLLEKVSAQGNRFVTYDCDDRKFTVRQISPMLTNSETGSNGTSWDVSVESVIIEDQRLQQLTALDFHLWKNDLIVLLEDGSTATWNFLDKTLQVRTYGLRYGLQFQYPVRSFMQRGLTFIDVTATRSLLGYWHIDTGPHPFWYVLSSSSSDILGRLNVLLPSDDEISAICFKLSFIIVASNIGKCYLYRNLDADTEILNHLSESRRPLLVFKLPQSYGNDNRRIRSCDVSFGKDQCLLALRTYDHSVFAAKFPRKKYR